MATGLDALIAELLGDVGKLHDEIKDLPTKLEAVTENYISRLERASSLIDDRIRDLRGVHTEASSELDVKTRELLEASSQLASMNSELLQAASSSIQSRLLATTQQITEHGKAESARLSSDFKSQISAVLDNARNIVVQEHMENYVDVSRFLSKTGTMILCLICGFAGAGFFALLQNVIR